jgi:3',5'-cyclic-AMP phosphodiesterase
VKLIHTSDWHIGGQAGEARQAEQLVAHLLARPDLDQLALVITGDITDDGQAAQWRVVQRTLAPLTGLLPIFMVPGNHDVGDHGITFDPVRAARSCDFIDAIATTPIRTVRGMRVWEWAAHKIVGLDSTRGQAGELLPPLARGELGAEQLAALEAELMDDIDTIILLHHHPRWHDQAHLLEDAGALTHLLNRRPRVRAVLYGHQHAEGTWGSATACLWLASGKSMALQGEHLQYRTLDCETMWVQTVSCLTPV